MQADAQELPKNESGAVLVLRFVRRTATFLRKQATACASNNPMSFWSRYLGTEP